MCGAWFFPFLALLGIFAIARRLHRYRCGGYGHGGCGHGGHDAYYGRGRRWGGPFRGPMRHWLFRELRLTPEQAHEVDDLLGKLQSDKDDLRQSGEAIRAELGKVLRTEGFDEDAAGDLLGKLDEGVDKAKKHALDLLARLHQVLDAEQRARLAAWIDGARFRRPGAPL